MLNININLVIVCKLLKLPVAPIVSPKTGPVKLIVDKEPANPITALFSIIVTSIAFMKNIYI